MYSLFWPWLLNGELIFYYRFVGKGTIQGAKTMHCKWSKWAVPLWTCLFNSGAVSHTCASFLFSSDWHISTTKDTTPTFEAASNKAVSCIILLDFFFCIFFKAFLSLFQPRAKKNSGALVTSAWYASLHMHLERNVILMYLRLSSIWANYIVRHCFILCRR